MFLRWFLSNGHVSCGAWYSLILPKQASEHIWSTCYEQNTQDLRWQLRSPCPESQHMAKSWLLSHKQKSFHWMLAKSLGGRWRKNHHVCLKVWWAEARGVFKQLLICALGQGLSSPDGRWSPSGAEGYEGVALSLDMPAEKDLRFFLKALLTQGTGLWGPFEEFQKSHLSLYLISWHSHLSMLGPHSDQLHETALLSSRDCACGTSLLYLVWPRFLHNRPGSLSLPGMGIFSIWGYFCFLFLWMFSLDFGSSFCFWYAKSFYHE